MSESSNAMAGETMRTVNVYVGADNDTHAIDLDRVAKIASRDVEGFTLWPAEGYWHGQAEPSAVLTVEAPAEDLRHLVTDLRTELHQEAIGVQPAEPIRFTGGDQT